MEPPGHPSRPVAPGNGQQAISPTQRLSSEQPRLLVKRIESLIEALGEIRDAIPHGVDGRAGALADGGDGLAGLGADGRAKLVGGSREVGDGVVGLGLRRGEGLAGVGLCLAERRVGFGLRIAERLAGLALRRGDGLADLALRRVDGIAGGLGGVDDGVQDVSGQAADVTALQCAWSVGASFCVEGGIAEEMVVLEGVVMG